MSERPTQAEIDEANSTQAQEEVPNYVYEHPPIPDGMQHNIWCWCDVRFCWVAQPHTDS